MNEAVEVVAETPEQRKRRKKKEYSKRYYERNKAKCAAARKRWERANSEKRRAWLKAYMADYNPRYQAANGNRIKRKAAEYRADNAGKLAAWRKNNRGYWVEWGIKNRDRISAVAKKWRERNRDRIRLAERARYRETNGAAAARQKLKHRPNMAMALRLRCRINMALRQAAATKHGSTIDLIGCTYPQLREHIEAQFTEGMSWSNWTRHGWHLDHVIPCAHFRLDDPAEQRKCFHFSNLAPKWWQDNLSKGAKLDWQKPA